MKNICISNESMYQKAIECCMFEINRTSKTKVMDVFMDVLGIFVDHSPNMVLLLSHDETQNNVVMLKFNCLSNLTTS